MVGVSGGLLRQRDQIGKVARIVVRSIGRLACRILDARQNRVQLIACLGQRLASLFAEVGFLLGMLRHRLYTYRWMSLLIWLYFTEGVVRAASDRGTSQWLAGIEVALSTALFIGCLVYVRQRLKVLPPKAKKDTKRGKNAKDAA